MHSKMKLFLFPGAVLVALSAIPLSAQPSGEVFHKGSTRS
jgi:hypothetical protein